MHCSSSPFRYKRGTSICEKKGYFCDVKEYMGDKGVYFREMKIFLLVSFSLESSEIANFSFV
jgi:hypothetical protein